MSFIRRAGLIIMANPQISIKKLVNFLYSNNSSKEVPFRLALITGQYSGFDLNENQCKKLLEFLTNPDNYTKEKFEEFLNKYIYEEENNG
jgi:hypothetical protein